MATKKKHALSAEPKAENPRALYIVRQQKETMADALAHASLRPTVQAALTLMDYNKLFGEISVNSLVTDLGKQCELASTGDLARAEALLVAQAHTLDSIFNMLARKATHCEYLNQIDVNLRLALKAQSQCRATLETLATLKHPPTVAFVRQVNIAHGPQQVNNGAVQSGEVPRAREIENQRNKQSGVANELLSDTGASAHTGCFDPQMEALGELNRPEVAER